MKITLVLKKIGLLCAVMALLAGVGTAHAGIFNNLPEVIVLKPGQDATRQFYLNDEFELDGFHNYESFIFVGLADNSTSPATKCGALTITLSTTATITYGSLIDYSLTGFTYPIGGTLDFNSFYYVKYTTPQKATKSITLNSMYAFGLVAAKIDSIEGEVSQPTPMTIVFSLAAPKKSS